MASRIPNTQLCDYCQQKPKFSGYQYCSKTCAKQAATLCNNCHKKPKYANFDYCGKNCAAAASTGNTPPLHNTINTSGTRVMGQTRVPNVLKGTNPAPQKPAKSSIDPMQIAQLVAQQIPQVQALLATANTASAQYTRAQPTPVRAPAVPPTAGIHGTKANPVPINSPFLASQPLKQSNAVPVTPPEDESDEEELECFLPGCEQPVHIDAKGTTASNYCSMRHREEAVASGLVPACIMCLTMPQSEIDYFCGRTCREEALAKPPIET